MEATKTGIVLSLGQNASREPWRIHEELHAPCGCAFHESPAPHGHPCKRQEASAAQEADEARMRYACWYAALAGPSIDALASRTPIAPNAIGRSCAPLSLKWAHPRSNVWLGARDNGSQLDP